MNQENRNAPVATHRDGATSAKVWRNVNKDGQPYYSVTFQRTYTNARTGSPAETHSFSGNDILKIQQLASESYRTIGTMREMDKAERAKAQEMQQPQQSQPEQQPQQNMEQLRDQAMDNAAPIQNQGQAREHVPERG